jgi:hypothetical protein
MEDDTNAGFSWALYLEYIAAVRWRKRFGKACFGRAQAEIAEMAGDELRSGGDLRLRFSKFGCRAGFCWFERRKPEGRHH